MYLTEEQLRKLIEPQPYHPQTIVVSPSTYEALKGFVPCIIEFKQGEMPMPGGTYKDSEFDYDDTVDECSEWDHDDFYAGMSTAAVVAGDSKLASLLSQAKRIDEQIAEHCRAVQAERRRVQETTAAISASLCQADPNDARYQINEYNQVMSVDKDELRARYSQPERTCSCGRVCDVGAPCWWCGNE